LTQPGPRKHRPHTGQTWPERCCRLPSGTPLERLGQGVIQAAPLPCPPRHGLRHRLGHARGHGPKPLALRRQPVDPVAVSEAPGAQRWRCGLRQGRGSGLTAAPQWASTRASRRAVCSGWCTEGRDAPGSAPVSLDLRL